MCSRFALQGIQLLFLKVVQLSFLRMYLNITYTKAWLIYEMKTNIWREKNKFKIGPLWQAFFALLSCVCTKIILLKL